MTEEQRLTGAVARALCVADGNDPDTWNGKAAVSGGITCDVALPTWENYVEAARAVIPVVLEEVQRHLSAVQYDPAPYTALKYRLRNLGSI